MQSLNQLEKIPLNAYKERIQKGVFIGLNYGANVAIELASSSSLVSHLVLIDPPILMGVEEVQSIQNHIDDLNNPAYENFAKTLVESVFFNTTEENKKSAIHAFETTPKETLTSIYQNLLMWDKTGYLKLERSTMPVLYIQSNEPFCSEEALLTYCPHLMTGKVVGSSHWATLETPQQVNGMIERFLEVVKNNEAYKETSKHTKI